MISESTKKSVDSWLKSNNLTIGDAASLAVIPRSTLKKIFAKKDKQTGSLGPQHRLYLLTGIEELKLGSDEFEEYLEQKRKDCNLDYLEKIATFFIQKYKSDGSFPKIKYRTSPTSDSRTPIDVVIKNVIDDGIVPGLINQPMNITKNKNTSSLKFKKELFGVSAIKDFKDQLQVLVQRGTNEEIRSIVGVSKKELQEIYGFIHLLLADNPTAAVAAARTNIF